MLLFTNMKKSETRNQILNWFMGGIKNHLEIHHFKMFFIHEIPIGPRPRGVFFNYIMFSLKVLKMSSKRPVDSRRYRVFIILPLKVILDALKVRSLPSKSEISPDG